LAITKRIVEQLDGTISVASELGKGTTFTMRFPVAQRPVAVAAAG
jgi:two-component system sensor histidine kinase BaeS